MWPSGLPPSKAVPGPPQPHLAPPSSVLTQLRGYHISISAGFGILHTFLFGFFRVLQKETLWEVLSPFSEPRVWLGPGEARKPILLE